MRDKIVAKRYGDAFIDFAVPLIGMERCIQEMKDLRSVLRETPEMVRFLKAPEIPISEKRRIIDKLFSDKVSDELRTFVQHLLKKGRVSLLASVAVYVCATYGHGNATEVFLRTTFPLDLPIIERIKEALRRRSGGDIKLYLEMDPALLGGIQIMVGNTILDASVRTRLTELRKHLMKT